MRELIEDLRLWAAGWLTVQAMRMVPDTHPCHGRAMEAFAKVGDTLS